MEDNEARKQSDYPENSFMHFRHHSNKAYEVLLDAGIFLPSQRTLRDYIHCTKSGTGFSSGVDHQLLLASKALTYQEWQKYIVILIDEMHIRYCRV